MKLMKKFSSQVVMISLFAGTILLSMTSGAVFQYSKISEFKTEISSLNNQIKDVNREIKKLKSKSEDIKDLEEIARTKLNMVKPNDIVYIDREGE